MLQTYYGNHNNKKTFRRNIENDSHTKTTSPLKSLKHEIV